MKGSLSLVRGLPGAGKTTYAERWNLPNKIVVSADDYFVNADGEYIYDEKLIAKAHEYCQKAAYDGLISGKNVVVANTFTMLWEMKPYFDMAEALGVDYKIYDLHDGGCSDEQLFSRNLHGVPLNRISRMRSRWQHHSGAINLKKDEYNV